jgi:hypothetical protein
MSNYKYNLSVLFLVFLFGLDLGAQNNGLPTGEVDVIDEFDARLIDAERFVVNPVLPPLDTSKKRMTYFIDGKALQVQYLPPRITPRRFSSPAMDPTYNGYIRAGAGLPRALYLDGAYDLSNEQSPIAFGFDLFHYSANNDNKVENQKFSNSLANINAAYYNDFGFSIDGDLGYKRDVVHFYGYNDLDDDFVGELTYAEDDVKQIFSTIYAKAQLRNNQPTVADIDYGADIDFYNLQDNYAARETGFRLSGEMTKWFDERHPVNAKVIVDFTNYQDTASQNLNNFFFQPSYAYHGDRFRVKVGVNLASHQDEFYVFPDIEAAANFIDNILTAFVGARGDLYKNNFQNLTDYNPFLSSRVSIRNSFNNRFYGGIKGEIIGIDYRVEASYEDVDNLALFTSNLDSIPRFNVVYDTANIVTLAAEVSAPLFENFELIGSFAQRVYSTSNNDKAWHLPSLTLNVGASYKLLDEKLTVRGDLFIENGVPVPTADGSKNLNGLLDLNGSAEYMFSDNIGGFVRVNNLLNNRRQRWRHYPTFGLNALVGVTAKF